MARTFRRTFSDALFQGLLDKLRNGFPLLVREQQELNSHVLSRSYTNHHALRLDKDARRIRRKMETDHDIGVGSERLRRYDQYPALANVLQSAQTIVLRGLALHLHQQSRALTISPLIGSRLGRGCFAWGNCETSLLTRVQALL